jgi:5'-deoxynucleotidase YfbR-like HD superfamily hydrolase
MNYALQVRDDARLAGRVIRYHTWPHIRQTCVAEHSWQLLRILLKIWPSVPAHVLAYVVRHDVGELTTGDAPYPVKVDNPVLGDEMRRVEAEALELQIAGGFLADTPELSPDEKWAVKLAEFIEMWEWALEELLLGNQFARLVAQRCYAVIQARTTRDYARSKDPANLPLGEFRQEIGDNAFKYTRRRKELWQIA